MRWLIRKSSLLSLFLCGSKLAIAPGKCGFISVYLLCRKRMKRRGWLWSQACSGPSGRGFFRELRNKITLVGVERHPALCWGGTMVCFVCGSWNRREFVGSDQSIFPVLAQNRQRHHLRCHLTEVTRWPLEG